MHTLADFLVGLKDKSQALSDQQVAEITKLWNNLVDYDKQGTVFSARYRKTQSKGRFRATKTTVSAGVESVRRYVLEWSAALVWSCIPWYECHRRGGGLNRCEIGVKIFLNCIKALSQLMYKIFKLYMNNLKVYNVPVVYIPSTFINVDHFF